MLHRRASENGKGYILYHLVKQNDNLLITTPQQTKPDDTNKLIEQEPVQSQKQEGSDVQITSTQLQIPSEQLQQQQSSSQPTTQVQQEILSKDSIIPKIQEQEEWIQEYVDFFPLLLPNITKKITLNEDQQLISGQKESNQRQSDQIFVKELDSFDSALDEYFSTIEENKGAQQRLNQEASAISRVETIKQTQLQRIEQMEAEAELYEAKATAVEVNSDSVQRCLDIVNGLVSTGADWTQISGIIRNQRLMGDQTAKLISSLRLDKNQIIIDLPNPNIEDDEEEDNKDNNQDEEEMDERADGDFEGYDEDADTKLKQKKEKQEQGKKNINKQQKQMENKQQKQMEKSKGRRKQKDEDAPPQGMLRIVLDLALSTHANIRELFERRKQILQDMRKAKAGGVEAVKMAQSKADAALAAVAVKERQQQLKKLRRRFWFEKFRWFISSDGYLVLCGKDATTNEMLVRRYLRQHDVYVHADIVGAASVVIKNIKKRKKTIPDSGDNTVQASEHAGEGSEDVDFNPIPPKTLTEAACMAAAHSRAWGSGISDVGAWWVHANQVKLSANAGLFMGKGSFFVIGRHNAIPQPSGDMSYAVMFVVDDASDKRRKRDLEIIRNGGNPYLGEEVDVNNDELMSMQSEMSIMSSLNSNINESVVSEMRPQSSSNPGATYGPGQIGSVRGQQKGNERGQQNRRGRGRGRVQQGRGKDIESISHFIPPQLDINCVYADDDDDIYDDTVQNINNETNTSQQNTKQQGKQQRKNKNKDNNQQNKDQNQNQSKQKLNQKNQEKNDQRGKIKEQTDSENQDAQSNNQEEDDDDNILNKVEEEESQDKIDKKQEDEQSQSSDDQNDSQIKDKQQSKQITSQQVGSNAPKQLPQIPQNLKRGQRSKYRKILKKYGDQDEEERRVRMALIHGGSAAEALLAAAQGNEEGSTGKKESIVTKNIAALMADNPLPGFLKTEEERKAEKQKQMKEEEERKIKQKEAQKGKKKKKNKKDKEKKNKWAENLNIIEVNNKEDDSEEKPHVELPRSFYGATTSEDVNTEGKDVNQSQILVCYYCKQSGHVKRDCPLLKQNKQGISNNNDETNKDAIGKDVDITEPSDENEQKIQEDEINIDTKEQNAEQQNENRNNEKGDQKPQASDTALTMISTLVGYPSPKDTIISAIPVVVPYSVAQGRYKYYAKLTPGHTKAQKAAKEVLTLFAYHPLATENELTFIKSIEDSEMVLNMVGPCRVDAQELSHQREKEQRKIKEKQKKKAQDFIKNLEIYE